MVACFSDRLVQYISKKPYVFAALLDINMKGCVFTREERAVNWDVLIHGMVEYLTRTRAPVQAPAVADNVVGLPRRAPGNREVNFLQNLLAENAVEEQDVQNPHADLRMEVEREVGMYKSYPQDVSLSTDARQWWATKRHMPTLRLFARKYLAFPVGEGDCERFFSKTGIIYCPRRKRLLPFNCKMMLVTNSALRAFQYTLDGDVKLHLPDFIVHERDIIDAVVINESDDDTNL